MITLSAVSEIIRGVIIFSVIGGILGLLIGIAAKFLHVEVDNRVEDIQKILPGANCGACGYPGCSGLADAIVNNGVDPKNCKSLKVEKLEDINAILNSKNKEN